MFPVRFDFNVYFLFSQMLGGPVRHLATTTSPFGAPRTQTTGFTDDELGDDRLMEGQGLRLFPTAPLPTQTKEQQPVSIYTSIAVPKTSSFDLTDLTEGNTTVVTKVKKRDGQGDAGSNDERRPEHQESKLIAGSSSDVGHGNKIRQGHTGFTNASRARATGEVGNKRSRRYAGSKPAEAATIATGDGGDPRRYSASTSTTCAKVSDSGTTGQGSDSVKQRPAVNKKEKKIAILDATNRRQQHRQTVGLSRCPPTDGRPALHVETVDRRITITHNTIARDVGKDVNPSHQRSGENKDGNRMASVATESEDDDDRKSRMVAAEARALATIDELDRAFRLSVAL